MDGAIARRFERAGWDVPQPAPQLDAGLDRRAPAAFQPSRIPLSRCPEIDCIRHRLPPQVVMRAEERATRIDVGADRVLIAEGQLAEESYLKALAAALQVRFEPLQDLPRIACPLNNDELAGAAQTGMLPIRDRDGLCIVVAPPLVDSRQLLRLARANSAILRRLRLTSPARLLRFIGEHGGHAIARHAVDALRRKDSSLSASSIRWRWRHGIAVAAALTGGVAMIPDAAVIAVEASLGVVFLAWIGLRLASITSRHAIAERPTSPGDRGLPIYTIIVALYRETAAVEGLVAALRALNYPSECLDIKIVVEPDDHDTLAALIGLRLGPPFEILIAPAVEPRTKPKALNVALPFARGEFIAIYDAEDRPEPDQLRLAVEAFEAGDRTLACVQARLTIDNNADGWLPQTFAAEYAGLFDVMLPSLADWRVPLPLGGSSNHFRASILRGVGAWDAYNVTEDADLGMRLARFGYRTAVIASTTYEEAPVKIRPWLKQRARWFKGWMQTWLVHTRTPLRLWRELGPVNFIVFQLLVGGTVIAALLHAPALAKLAFELCTGRASGGIAMDFYLAILAAGYLMSAVLGVLGLKRRRLLGSAWALLFIPVHWILLSAAAWRALFQLIRDPYRWEKTDHGLARTSRLARSATLKNASAGRPPRPQACA